MGDITEELIAARGGGQELFNRLFDRLYPQLKVIARRQMASEGQLTLGATGLIHEAYLKLVDGARVDYQDRRHFFAVASRAMRQIAVDHARRRLTAKRGAGVRAETLDEGRSADRATPEEVVAIDLALAKLATAGERLVQVVELCFFTGLTAEEAGEVLEVSTRTIKRDWRKARILLAEWI